MLTSRRNPAVVLAVAALVWPTKSLSGQFGELPPGHVRRQTLDGVRAEIGRTFLLDSSVAARFAPAGTSLVTLGLLATIDSATARYLASRPELATAVPSVLGFADVDSVRIDDGPPMRVRLAFWWLRARPTPPAHGPVSGEGFVEAASWSPDSAYVRLEEPGWPLRYARVQIERATDGEWRVGLTSKEATIHGRCRPSGAPTAAGSPMPTYNTIWAGTGTATAHQIYSFYGHRIQACTGEWTATGSHPLAIAIARTAAELPPAAQTTFMDGWRARAATYRR